MQIYDSIMMIIIIIILQINKLIKELLLVKFIILKNKKY